MARGYLKYPFGYGFDWEKFSEKNNKKTKERKIRIGLYLVTLECKSKTPESFKLFFMSVNSKHIATFLLGAAAGFAAFKYSSMTEEEKEKMMADIKAKANSFKDEAEGMADKAKDYFEELKTKGSSAFKENMGDVESMFNDLFGKKNPDEKAV